MTYFARISRSWLGSPAAEFVAWGFCFLAARLVVLWCAPHGPYSCDEVNFVGSALRMAQNRFDTGDYMHGPVLCYGLLGTFVCAGLFELLTGGIKSTTDFVRWYAERPGDFQQLGRAFLAFSGAVLIVAVMGAAYASSRSRTHARFAAVLLLSMPLFQHASWFIKEDIWAACFGIIAGAAAYRGRPAFAVGVWLGIGVASKYPAVLLAPALWLLVMRLDLEQSFTWRSILTRTVAFGAGVAVAFVVVNPYCVLHFQQFRETLAGINNVYLKGKVGDRASLPRLAGVVFTEYLPVDVGLLAVVAALGAVAIPKPRFRVFLVPMTAITAVIAILAMSRVGFPRTLTLALPWLALAGGAALSRVDQAYPRMRYALALCVVAQIIPFYRYVTAPDTRHEAFRFAETTLPTDSVILMESVFDNIPESAPSLRPNAHALDQELAAQRARGATGRIGTLRRAAAVNDPRGRFEIHPAIDFVDTKPLAFDGVDVVVEARWPGLYPENRCQNLPEDAGDPRVQDYNARRQTFFDAATARGFQPAAEFLPTWPARWCFIDRPDPNVVGLRVGLF